MKGSVVPLHYHADTPERTTTAVGPHAKLCVKVSDHHRRDPYRRMEYEECY